MKERFLELCEQPAIQVFLAFLKELTELQKKELMRGLKRNEIIFSNGYLKANYVYTGTCLYCCKTAKEFLELTECFSKNSPELTDVLQLHCPEWLDEYLETAEPPHHINYPLLLEWIQKGFATPDKRVIGRSLGFNICHNIITIEQLEAYPVTLNEHIWFIFDQVWYPENSKILAHYISNGRLDRERLFKSSLTPGFYKLCIELSPVPDEIKKFQHELFQAATHSDNRVVYTALQNIKQIVTEEDFRVDDFLLAVDRIVHQVETKKTINLLLSILEKIAKKWDTARTNLCRLLIPLFIHKDDNIQKKLAKLISTYGEAIDEELKKSLSAYSFNLLQSVRPELKPYLVESNTNHPETEMINQHPEPRIFESNKIKYPETWEDFQFYLSALPNSEEPYIWEMLPVALKQFDSRITEENLNLFQHVFNHAYTKGFNSETGYFHNIYCLYLIEYGRLLQRRFPEAMFWFEKLYSKQQEKERTTRYAPPLPLTPLEEWFGQKTACFQPLYKRMVFNWKIMVENNNLPLLSMPTHTPCWIDASILVERILQYQLHEQVPDQTDFELALSRCVVENKDEFLQNITTQLTPLYFKPVAEWYQNTMAEVETYTQQITWNVSSQKQQAEDYKDRFPLSIQLPENPWFKDHFLYPIGKSYIGTDDLPHFLWCYPNTPEPIYAHLMNYCFRFSQIGLATTRDFHLHAIRFLDSYKGEIREMTGLFLACTLLVSNKNILDYGTAIWIGKTTERKINNKQFGTILGKLLNGEWAPVKRLTENIQLNLLNIDQHHNQALEELLTNLLVQIIHPVTNLSSLLEIYAEVLALNRAKAYIDQIPQVNNWAVDKKLKTIINRILKP